VPRHGITQTKQRLQTLESDNEDDDEGEEIPSVPRVGAAKNCAPPKKGRTSPKESERKKSELIRKGKAESEGLPFGEDDDEPTEVGRTRPPSVSAVFVAAQACCSCSFPRGRSRIDRASLVKGGGFERWFANVGGTAKSAPGRRTFMALIE
jgi:hypothetical protein